jgi:NADPH:quinone reductase-like Zn-dependent oxidoreductase
VVYRSFPAAHAVDAHRVLEGGEHVGKLVLTW